MPTGPRTTTDALDGAAASLGERRLFIAVPLAEPAARAIASLVDGVRAADGVSVTGSGKRGGRDVRWVRLDTLHVTVRFLGQTAEERIAEIAEATAEIAGRTQPFEVVISGGGAFPSPDRPRVLWLGIAAGGDDLERLAATTNERLAAIGWEPDTRPFRAHLTLARSDVVRAGPRLARRLIAAAEGLSTRWQADRLVLFESVTGGGPARHLPLTEADRTAARW